MERDRQTFYSPAAAGGATAGDSTPTRTETIDQETRTGGVREALAVLLAPGDVAELRAIGRESPVASGYFDDHGLLAAKADALDASGEYSGIYVTLNPVNPALLARRANRVQRRLGPREATTADGDTLSRRWLPVDIDPVRASGISATDDERAAAFAVAEAIGAHLSGRGWPGPVLADSGNGAHLLYRVDLPNDEASTALVKGALAALDARFSTAAVKVDTANHNAARIWKLYGTVSRKGDSTQDRPHRRSAVLAAPGAPRSVPAERLRALAGAGAVVPAPPPPAPGGGTGLRAWLERHGIVVAAEKPWQGGRLYNLAACPFSDAHTDGAYAIEFDGGGVLAACHHDSCGAGRQRWPELRARFEPAASAPAPGPDAAAAAAEVLACGDPLAYFLDCFARDHVGDETLAHCMIMSIASQSVLNTHGLHVYVTGESGKGKSSGMTAMLKQVPEEFKLAERLSDKALYYSDDIGPGTVLLLDDIALSDELQEVLKEATSRFTERIGMRTVDTDRKVRHCSIPERCTWWLANVSAIYDVQVLNRMLTCWVDDSEAQDAEVFRRQLANEARPPGEAVRPRFDLSVCQECWRAVRAEGLVHVAVPFAEGIRMASASNRRNPLVLLDLVRSHALLFLRQRSSERLADGTLAVTATVEDFRYAAGLFAALHAGGGSLGSKFDRNEDRVLAEAARRGAERFTVGDIQRWTGWTYQKSRRTMMGYTGRGGVRYPGLLDRSPALSLVDQTVADPDGGDRDVRLRRLVFVFDAGVHRETRSRGEAWLEGGPDGHRASQCSAGDRRVDHDNAARDGRETGVEGESADISRPCVNSADHTASPSSQSSRSVPVPGDHAVEEMADAGADKESDEENPFPGASTGRSTPWSTGVHHADCSPVPGPRAFAPLDEPAPVPCDACGRRPSHFREVRPNGEPRHLCRACHGAAVRRERRAGPPLPAVIDTDGLRTVAASVGRCDVCGLEAAAFSGGGVRLCGPCFDRESRR